MICDRYTSVDASFQGPGDGSIATSTVDVTSYVRDVLAGVADDYGWVVQASNESTSDARINMNSSEDDDPLYLDVTVSDYVIATASGTNLTDDITMKDGWNIGGDYTSCYIGVHGNGSVYRSAIRFDIDSLDLDGWVVTNAVLSIHVQLANDAYSQTTFNLHRLRRHFVEEDFATGGALCTWDNYDATHSWATAGADNTSLDRYAAVDTSFTGPDTDSYVEIEINVTDYVLDVVNGRVDDLGWLIKSANESSTGTLVMFRSSEHADVPTLEIAARPPQGTIVVVR